MLERVSRETEGGRKKEGRKKEGKRKGRKKKGSNRCRIGMEKRATELNKSMVLDSGTRDCLRSCIIELHRGRTSGTYQGWDSCTSHL